MRALLVLLCVAWSASGQEWVQELRSGFLYVGSLTVDFAGNSYVSGFSGGTNVLLLGSTNLAPGPFFIRYNCHGRMDYAHETAETRVLATVGNKVFALDGTNLFQVRSKGRLVRKAILASPGLSVRSISPCDGHSLVIAGEFRESLTIGRKVLFSSVTNGRTFFVARLTTAGKPIWITEVPHLFISDVAGTREGGAYVLLLGYSVVGTNEYGIPIQLRNDIPIRALNERGEVSWESGIAGNYSGFGSSIAVDRDGRCFVAGRLGEGYVLVGDQVYRPIGSRTAFVYGFHKTGKPSFVWMLNRPRGPFSGGVGQGSLFSGASQVTVDRQNNWLVGNYYYPGDGSGSDGLVVKNGDQNSAVRFGGTGSDMFQRMAVGRANSLFIAGQCWFRASDSVSSIGTARMTNNGAFLAKFKL
jgi:hypothetical protein